MTTTITKATAATTTISIRQSIRIPFTVRRFVGSSRRRGGEGDAETDVDADADLPQLG